VDPASRALLEGWIAGVLTRPEHHCGVFTGTDGDPFDHRARPWDYPDILMSGRVDDESLLLVLSDGVFRVDDVRAVARGEHAWGPGLLVSGTISGAPAGVWLV